MNSYVAGAGNIFLYWYRCALNVSIKQVLSDRWHFRWMGLLVPLFICLLEKNVTSTSVCPILAMAPGKHQFMHVSFLKYEND